MKRQTTEANKGNEETRRSALFSIQPLAFSLFFSLQLFAISLFGQTRSAVVVSNATGVLAAPTNFFAANSNLLNQAVNNNHGSGGGGGGSTSPDGVTTSLNGSGQMTAAPLGLMVSNQFETITGAQTLATNATNEALALALNNSNLSYAVGLANSNLSLALGSTLWPSVIFVSTAGNDANPGTNILQPVLTITNALAIATNIQAAIGGPILVKLGPGVFPVQVSQWHISSNTAIIGDGQNVTTILPLTNATTTGLYIWGDNIYLRGFSYGTNTFNGVYYYGLSLNRGTNFYAEDVSFVGDSDCIYSYGSSYFISGTFFNCAFTSGYDTVNFVKPVGVYTNSWLNFLNCAFTINHDPAFSAAPCRGIAVGSARVFAQNCVFNLTNSTDGNKVMPIELYNATSGQPSAVVTVQNNIYNCTNTFSPASAPILIDPPGSSGTLNVLGQFDPANVSITTSGTVNYPNAQFAAVTASTFSGSGASLTSLPAGQLTGTIATNREPGALADWSVVPTNSLAAGSVSSGTLPLARLPSVFTLTNAIGSSNITASIGNASGSTNWLSVSNNGAPVFNISTNGDLNFAGNLAGSLPAGNLTGTLSGLTLNNMTLNGTGSMSAGVITSGTLSTSVLPGQLPQLSIGNGGALTNVLTSLPVGLSTNSIMYLPRHYGWYSIGSTTPAVVGTGAGYAAVAGTLVACSSTQFPAVRFATGATSSNTNGFVDSNNDVPTKTSQWQFMLDVTNTSACRLWVGLNHSAYTAVSQNTPTTANYSCVMFYCDSTNDTRWIFLTGDGTGYTQTTNSSISLSTSPTLLSFQIIASGGTMSQAIAYINGLPIATNTTHLPSSVYSIQETLTTTAAAVNAVEMYYMDGYVLP